MSTMNNEHRGNTSDIHVVMNAAHEDFNNEAVRKLAIQRNTVCDLCLGTGRRNGTDEEDEDCEVCWGAGVVQTRNKDTKKEVHIQCRECRSKGKMIVLQNRCGQCKGKAFQQDRFILEVDIKKGMYCGRKVAYRAEENLELNLNFEHLNTILEEIKHNQGEHNGDAESSA